MKFPPGTKWYVDDSGETWLHVDSFCELTGISSRTITNRPQDYRRKNMNGGKAHKCWISWTQYAGKAKIKGERTVRPRAQVKHFVPRRPTFADGDAFEVINRQKREVVGK